MFNIRDRGSTVSREVIGGVTTFMAMSYIIFVQVGVLGKTGMDHGGIIMATFAAITFFQAARRGKKEVGEKEVSFLTPKWPKLVAMLIILMAYALLLESLGFIAITFIALICLLKSVESTKWRIALVEASLATFVSYTLFGLWLKVPLPKGFWPSLFH